MGKRVWTSKNADKYELYENAVQCVEADIDFLDKIYKERNGKLPTTLREDFCGTFAASVEFVRRRTGNRAWAVDIDSSVLEWEKKRHAKRLGNCKSSLTVIESDVLTCKTPRVDAIFAMNFSYMIFKRREELKAYFNSVYKSLKKNGMFFIDLMGGWETQQIQRDKRKKKGFTYVWDQHDYNPITHEVINYIHFYFPDGTKLLRAFEYHWRLWTLRELTDLFEETGFRFIQAYWEGWDEKQKEGDGVFLSVQKGENCPAWVAYIVCQR